MLSLLNDMAFSEQQLEKWGEPINETHQIKCQNTIDEIKTLLSAKFGNKVTLSLQGSYKNRTNIKIDSDVDILIKYNGVNFVNRQFLTPEHDRLYELYRTPATYTFSQFKNDVYDVLKTRYPYSAERKNKCIRIKESEDRVKADVVPCFKHRRLKTFDEASAIGIELITDSGESVISFPEQHYENGNIKNKDTNYNYKPTVRALKHIRKHLEDNGIIEPEYMSSFFIECLVWNTNHFHFTGSRKEVLTKITRQIWYDMNQLKHAEYTEVSDLRWLFKGNGHDYKKAEKFMWEAYSILK